MIKNLLRLSIIFSRTAEDFAPLKKVLTIFRLQNMLPVASVTKLFTLLVLVFIGSPLLAQQADTVIYAEGRIINAATKEPVSARITYQSLPYGNRIGLLNNSSYSFPMFEKERYSITVEAPGFATAKYMLDPAEANEQLRVIRDIELSVGSASNIHSVGHVMRLNNLIFEVGRSRISSESYDELDLVVKMMNENPKMVIQLEGHTDYLGDPNANMKLSQDRVKLVKDYLTDRGKINKNRIKTKAFGGTMPLSRDNTPEAHRLNRRVELRILEN